MLAITCPTSGKLVSTGIETDSRSFALLPNLLTYSLCPICGLEHVWRKSEAQLIETPAAAEIH